jgi:hypothetical protein
LPAVSSQVIIFITGGEKQMNEIGIPTRSIFSTIVGGFVLRVVEPLERLFGGSVDLQHRGTLIRAYARKHDVYLVPEILNQPEQCPCSQQHTTFMLVHSSNRSYCFDCWNAQREECLTQASKFHLDLSLREWGCLHDILKITSANLKRTLDGQPIEYLELKDFDLFCHLCEGIIEVLSPPEKTFQSLASVSRDADRVSVDLDLQEMDLVRISAVAMAEMLKSSLEPRVTPELAYEGIPKKERPASIPAIDLLADKLTNAILNRRKKNEVMG